MGKMTGVALALASLLIMGYVLLENTIGSTYIGILLGIFIVVPLFLSNLLISIAYRSRNVEPNTYLWMWGPSLAVLVFFGIVGGAVEFNESQSKPEEWLRVGSFELGRWKVHYRSGENNSTSDDYYWNSIVKFRGKQIDFCSPRGWGGGNLCSEKRLRGRFDRAYVVSDNPPSLLLQYGGADGNNDGELWLFSERNQELERQRVAINYSDRVRDKNEQWFDRDQEWDLRKQSIIILDSDNWLETTPLHHLELARPFSFGHLRVASHSPNHRYVARIGYSDISGGDRGQLLLVVTNLSNPLVPDVYLVEGPESTKPGARDHVAQNFDNYLEWGGKSGGDLQALIPEEVKTKRAKAVIERNSLKSLPPDSYAPETTYVIPAASAEHLPALCETICSAIQENTQVTSISSSAKSLDLGDSGAVSLKATETGVQVKELQSNPNSSRQTTRYVAAIVQEALLGGQLSLAKGSKAESIRQQCR